MADFDLKGKTYGLVVGNDVSMMGKEPFWDDTGTHFEIRYLWIRDMEWYSNKEGRQFISSIRDRFKNRVYDRFDNVDEALRALEDLDMKCELELNYPPVPKEDTICNAWVIDEGGHPVVHGGELAKRNFIIDTKEVPAFL